MRTVLLALISTAVIGLFGANTLSAQGNGGAAVLKQIPRTPQGKPDFNGFFDLPYVPNMAGTARPSGQGVAAEDGLPAGEADVPYTAAGKSAYVNHDAKDDPTSNCWLPGVPRIMQSPYPVQFVQTADHLAILFEYMHTFRSIPLNGFRRTPGNIEYEYTVDDPAMYAKPWTLKRILRPLPPVAGLPELLEYSCTENNQDIRHLVPTKPALGLK